MGRIAHRQFLGGDNPLLLVEDMDLSKIQKSPRKIFCAPIMIDKLDGSPVNIIAEMVKLPEIIIYDFDGVICDSVDIKLKLS